jgi:hypothetical protein
MQEPGQHGGQWEKRPVGRIASLNGTGKHRPIPQRPPGMTRVNRPPQPSTTPRVARPQRQESPLLGTRRRLIFIGAIIVICTLLACVAGGVVTNFLNGLNVSSSAASTAGDFMTSLSSQNYTQAYKDLGASITIQMAQDDFIQKAQNDDRCYGQITRVSEVPNSATSQDNSQSYNYDITRSKLNKSYQLRLTLQQDQGGTANWKIMDYGNDLGPSQAPTCK